MKRCLNCMEEYGEEKQQCPVCGYQEDIENEERTVLLPGSILQGRYIVGTHQAIRETDITYIGWDALFERKILIQEFFPAYCCGVRVGKEEVSIFDSKEELFEQGLRQYIAHGRELIRLYREEDIITVYSCFKANKTGYLTMEYRELDSLGEWIGDRTINVRGALVLLRQAMEAVEKLHEVGVIHGQIGLESFWISGGKQLILKDFGESKYICGKPGGLDYQNAGPWTDVYGLAAMFCRLVTGKAVKSGEREDMILPDSRLGISGNIGRALKNALVEVPGCRIQTVGEFERQIFGKKLVRRSVVKKNHKAYSTRLAASVKIGAILIVAALAGASVLFAGHTSSREELGGKTSEKNMAVVPNLINKELDEVERLSKSRGISVQIRAWIYSEDTDYGKVVRQDLKAGTELTAEELKKRGILVDVSSGKPRTTVPDVVGDAKKTAEKKMKAASLRWEYVEKEYAAAAGTVVEQDAGAGTSAEVNSVIRLTVSLGEPGGDPAVSAEVADLAGMDCSEAAEVLKKAHLYLLIGNREWSDTVQEGGIISQNPAAGTMLKQKSNVKVTVSRGKEKAEIPEVKNLSLAEATKMLEEKGFRVEVKEAASELVAKGLIIEQRGAAHEMAEKGTVIVITVSRGKKPSQRENTENNVPQETRRTSDTSAADSSEKPAAETAEATVPPAEAVAPLQTEPPHSSVEAVLGNTADSSPAAETVVEPAPEPTETLEAERTAGEPPVIESEIQESIPRADRNIEAPGPDGSNTILEEIKASIFKN